MKSFKVSQVLAVLVLSLGCATTVFAGPISGSLVAQKFVDLNLTTEGTLDWAVWGEGSSTSLAPTTRMSGGGGSISNLTQLSNGLRNVGHFGDYGESNFDWTNGTPNASATHRFTGIQFVNVDGGQDGLPGDGTTSGDGFSFTVAAGTTPEELRLYMTVNFGTALLTATLSDGGTLTQNLNIYPGSGGFNGPYLSTIDFNALSAGQTLTVTVRLTQSNLNANVAIQGLDLSFPSQQQSDTVPEPATISLVGISLAGLFAKLKKKQ
jgi:hypothetical protein